MITNLLQSKIFQRYLLPGFVFQSIIIAGGYGTGRELVEFFLHYGPRGGLMGMLLIAMVTMSVTAAASFEFARVFQTFNYRAFFVQLLGRAWLLYEVFYLVAVVLIMAVIGAAAGTIISELFGLPEVTGMLGVLLAVGFLVFKGSKTIESVMAVWSLVLYAAYAVFFAWSISRFGTEMASGLTTHAPEPGWMLGGLKYGVLQVSLIPAVLFTVRHVETRREAVGAGLLAGVIALVPALLFYLSMVGQYPQIVDRPVPANFMLEQLGSRAFQLTFQIVLFGTLIETGAGLIHAFNERLASALAETRRELPPFARPAVAVGLLVVGALLSRFGIVALVGRGYGTVAWVFLFIYVMPLLTYGVWKIQTGGRADGQTGLSS